MIPFPFQLGQLGASQPAAGGGGGGSYPVVLSVTASELGAAAGTSHLVAMPATVSAGDLLIALLAIDGNPSATTPSGWTALANNAPAGNTNSGRIFYKVAAGTEGGTTVDFVTASSVRLMGQVYRIQAGTYQATPEAASANNLGSTTPDPPSLSPSWGSASNLWIAFASSDNTVSVSVYPLPNNQTRTANASGGTAFITAMSCSDEQTGSSLDPGTFTISVSRAWAAFTVAVRPV